MFNFSTGNYCNVNDLNLRFEEITLMLHTFITDKINMWPLSPRVTHLPRAHGHFTHRWGEVAFLNIFLNPSSG